MEKRENLPCPNPNCKNGEVQVMEGILPFTIPCPTCHGSGYVTTGEQVPDKKN